MVSEYRSFGLKANMHKTTSGRVGEFLRRVISRGGNWAYPALGLRSICYANPWLDHYTYHEEIEVSNCWLTYLSRMWPHAVNGVGLMSFIKSHCIMNLKQLFGDYDWDSWLSTPISAGGGGCLEMSDVSKWVFFDKIHDSTQYGKSRFLKMTFGLIPYKKVLKENPTMKKMDLEPVIRLKDDLQGTSLVPPDTWFKHGVNIIRTVNDYLYGVISTSALIKTLTFSLPRGLRTSSPQRVIAFLMQGPKVYAGISTIQHTKEALQSYSYLGEYAVKAISNSKRYANIRYLQAAVTIYMTQLMRNVYIPFGTW
ncbi:RNA-dependent RNA polymerase [Lasius niger]|uniref:RNA-dependent RNA polymerase n=1 Tax=Lasius niger TaxID=67767 RepID=A0A0J7NLY8_LASNI|nr:RNA-dependent RNA polymerase [Lasius niger]